MRTLTSCPLTSACTAASALPLTPAYRAMPACASAAAADAAADENVGLQLAEETGQSAVAAAVGGDNTQLRDLTVFHVIELKSFGVAKVLENLAVFIGNCNSHNSISFRFFILLTIMLFIT